MSNRIRIEQPGAKWFNSPLTTYKDKSLDEIRSLIPEFERRPSLAMISNNHEAVRFNDRLHTIIRKPIGENKESVPVGVVSSSYTLVQHSKVFDEAVVALQKENIDIHSVKSILRMTEYGERMHLSLFLPDRFTFDPGDGNRMALRLECFNSVEGSTRFRVLISWFRLVCSNGLVMRVTGYDFGRRHLGSVGPEDIRDVIRNGIDESAKDKTLLNKWLGIGVKDVRLREWIQETVRKEWGLIAATRLYYISQSGKDIEIPRGYKGKTPFDFQVGVTKSVPGAPEKANNLFDLSQILAWLAKEQRDVQDQVAWREQIPALLKPLMN